MSHSQSCLVGLATLALLPPTALAQTAPDLAIVDVQVQGLDEDGLELGMTVRNESLVRTEPVTLQLQAVLATDDALVGPHEEVGRWDFTVDLARGETESFDVTVRPVITHDPACYDLLVGRLRFDPDIDTNPDDNLAAAPLTDCGDEGPPPDPPIAPVTPAGFELLETWFASELGIPDKLGGMELVDGGARLLVATRSNTFDSVVYAFDVVRGPSGRIVQLVTPRVAFDSRSDAPVRGPVGVGADLERDAEGRLVYPSWGENELRERPNDVELLYQPAERVVLPIPPTVNGLARSPQRDEWLVSVGFAPTLYLLPESDFLRYAARRFVDLETPAGGLAFVPRGPWEGDLFFTDWNAGVIRRLRVDPDTGFAIDAERGVAVNGTPNPVVELFAEGLGRGPWGLEFDSPRTNDLLVSTWTHGPDDRILLFSGIALGRASPVVEDLEYRVQFGRSLDVELLGTDADTPFLRYEILDELRLGRLEGDAPNLVYVPEVDVQFLEREEFRYVATDGTYTSDPAMVTIEVVPQVGCSGCSGAGAGSVPWWFLGLAALARRRRTPPRRVP